MATSGGFMEVSNNEATILVETAEFLEEIDYGRAQEELQRAENLLNMDLSRSDREIAEHSRRKARNRLAIIKKHE
jgi:F-type H+-transporting ATPase subunit epsilon